MNGNKTILTLLPSDCLGGAEKVLKLVVEEWINTPDQDGEVVFLKKSECGSWEDVVKNTNKYYSKYTQERSTIWYSIKHIYSISRRKDIELTIASNTVMVGWLGFLRKIGVLKTKYLVGRESTQLLDRFTGLKRLMALFFYNIGYNNLDLIVCQTSYMMERFYIQLPKAKKWNVSVIPNPFQYPERNTKSDVSFSKFGKYIVGAGRLIHLKGFDILIKSLQSFDGYNLVILGDGQEEENLRNLIKELGLTNRVFLMGKVDNVYDYFQNAEIGIVSSRVEGFPNTLLEMMSVCDSVVSTLCAGDIDKIEGVITCDIDNVEEMVKAIQAAIDQSHDTKQLNRLSFDKELQNRKPELFLKKIYENLDYKRIDD